MRMPASYQFALTFALVLGHVQLQGMVLARVLTQKHQRSNMTRITPAHSHHAGSNHTFFGQDSRLNYTSSASFPKNITLPARIVNQTWTSQNFQHDLGKSSQAPVHNQTWLYTHKTYYSSAPLHHPTGLQSSEVPRHVPTSSIWEGSPSSIFIADNNTHVGNSSSGWHHVGSYHNSSLASVASSGNFTSLPIARGGKPNTSSPFANLVY
ncbi:uncharacterized protein LOC117895113 [Drosophila subobscura]|uniref:uncharacterized protein LOC117895113 n=1 Tax=Drosophila subobscura TaxID=7241 RepID=UPI00155A0A17|nr:uncharacterized protein LOC117895113 [Drosophila subobscura]